MIEKLILRNFQGHRKLVLEFDPRITAITGATDAGKSSVIRALSWVALNRPKGDEFIQWGRSFAASSLFVDGRCVKRKRGTKGNVYEIDGKELKAFGAEVPPEIRAALGIEQLNFQSQHDAPFWFSLSPPDVSRRLNDIVDLSIIDETLASVASVLRKNRAVVEVSASRLDAARARCFALSFVEALHEDLTHVEGTYQQLGEVLSQLVDLQILIADAEEHQAAAKRKRPDFTKANAALEAVEKVNRELDQLWTAIKDADWHTAERNKARVLAGDVEKELHKLLKGKCPLCHQKIPHSL